MLGDLTASSTKGCIDICMGVVKMGQINGTICDAQVNETSTEIHHLNDLLIQAGLLSQ
jgi:hypothetical protein